MAGGSDPVVDADAAVRAYNPAPSTGGDAGSSNDYWKQRTFRPGSQYVGGYSGIPSYASMGYNTGWAAMNGSQLRESFWSNPQTQAIVMAATSAAYGYPVKNLLMGQSMLEGFAEDSYNNPSGMSPWQKVMALYNGEAGTAPGSGGGGGGGGGGGAPTNTVQLTDPDSAKQLINTAMASLLGRQATTDEFDTFLKTLNQAEMDNPLTVKIEGNTAIQSGGVNAAQRAQDYTQSRPDYAEFQSATTLMDAFISALDDPVDL